MNLTHLKASIWTFFKQNAQALLLAGVLFTLFSPYLQADAVSMSLQHELSKDEDQDGLLDVMEASFGTNTHEADTDGDGQSDAVELFDLGTNPLEQDTPSDVVLLSPDPYVRVASKHLFVKGYSNTTVRTLDLVTNDHRASYDMEVDSRGLFSKMIDLEPFCGAAKETTLLMMSDGKVLTEVQLLCSSRYATHVLRNTSFAGIALSALQQGNTPILESQDEALLVAEMPHYTKMKASFHSLVFSTGVITDSTNKTVAFVPHQPLESGSHRVVLELYDTERKLLFEPVVFGFYMNVADSPDESLLKAQVLMSTSGVAFSLFVGLIGALYTRRLRKKEEE